MRGITPFLWFDGELEEAIDFYTSVFPNGKVHGVVRSPDGEAFVAEFELAGQRFTALNGGPHFQFNEAVSFVVECDDQEEVDRYWAALTSGDGEPIQCGWLRDRFGLVWQVVPIEVYRMLSEGNPEQRQRVTDAIQPMVKLDLATLRAAYEG